MSDLHCMLAATYVQDRMERATAERRVREARAAQTRAPKRAPARRARLKLRLRGVSGA